MEYKSPAYNVIAIPIEKIKPNTYNPNAVAPPEMKLLYESIKEDGYTMPIVCYYVKKKDIYLIVDGFHRYQIMLDHPDIYERAAQRLNLAPQDCIVFEDAISGIESARRAGAGKIIAVASFEPRETYQSNSAVSQIIEDFDQFDAQKWLKSMD